jgi:hypothetical protein
VPDKSPFPGIEIQGTVYSKKKNRNIFVDKVGDENWASSASGEVVITRLEANTKQTCLLGLLEKLSEDRRISI